MNGTAPTATHVDSAAPPTIAPTELAVLQHLHSLAQAAQTEAQIAQRNLQAYMATLWQTHGLDGAAQVDLASGVITQPAAVEEPA